MSLTPRRRTRYRLPNFEAYATLRADKAAFDKIQVLVSRYAVPIRGQDSFHRMLYMLGQSRVFVRAGSPGTPSGNRFHLRGGEDRSPWLFNANVRFRSRPQQDAASASIEMWLNPIRFAAYRGRELEAIRGQSAWDALQVDPDTQRLIRSRTLDGSDNMIFPQAVVHPPDWIAHAAIYFEKVRELIDGEIAGAMAAAGVPGQLPEGRWGGLVLSHAEVAWEFHQPSAVSFVHRLVPRLRAIANELEVSIYGTARPAPTSSQPTIRHRTRNNAVQAVVNVLGEDRRKIGAVFYAKEHDRLRLELRYERNVRDLLGSARLAGVPFTFESLPQYLREVRVDARERMNAVLSPLDMEPLEDDEDHSSVFELVGHVARACGERTDLVPVVLELLTVNGGISVTNEFLEVVVTELERVGVVRHVQTRKRNRGAQRYALHRDYQAIVIGLLCSEDDK